jgi:hypothetical protein
MSKREFEKESARLLDRTSDVRACAGRINDAWSYDLDSRSFGPAHFDPEMGAYTTELDLAVLMSSLMKRGAVIQFPSNYKARRAKTQTEGEIIVDSKNRHGRILGMTSNKAAWSFNVLFDDANVITTDETGKPRNFMLQDIDGTWHEAWSPLVFISKTDAEKKLFENTNSIRVQYFVHPMRWPSIYGRPYLAAKIAIARLEDHDRFLRGEQKRIREACSIEPPQWPKSAKVGEDRPIKVWAFEARVRGTDFTGEYAEFETSEAGLKEASSLRKRIKQLVTQLRFNTRCSEFAFWKEAVCRPLSNARVRGADALLDIEDDRVMDWLKGSGNGVAIRKPSWCGDEWVTAHKDSSRSRTHWATLSRDNGLRLDWRCWRKTERVAV